MPGLTPRILRVVRIPISVSLVALTLLLSVTPVRAQGVEELDAPIGRFVFDLHGAISPWGQDGDLAIRNGFNPSTQPGRGIGLGGGAHVYVLRWRFLTLGVGANAVVIAGSKRPGAGDPDPNAPALNKRLTALSSQLSFNFGGRNGWSYLSGGPGTSKMSLYDRDADEPRQAGARTINFGFGARWFTNDHLAFALDLRFYNAAEVPVTEAAPGSPRMTTMVLSIGAAFK